MTSTKEMLKQLGSGRSIAEVCQQAEMTREQFDAWWKQECQSRQPCCDGSQDAAVGAAVEIQRDALGIPHIYAESDDDLFFGFGLAMAQDRLFQLDYLRRKASGRLAEVMGREKGFQWDLISRTVGLRKIAQGLWEQLDASTKKLVEAFSRGINAVIESDAPVPIEFDLLDYEIEPWSPVDCIAIEVEFGWYLTGRFPVIVIPELAKRTLGEGPLYESFLLGEADEAAILPPGAYPADRSGSQPVGAVIGDPSEGIGSNNWVVAGSKSTTGQPMVASDPHIAFEAVSCWYEAHLSGGSFDVTGTAYVGMPAIMFGRNRRVAWAITNNICSQRDLYQEKTDPAHLGCFQYDGQWEEAKQRTETIRVRGEAGVQKTITTTRNGPLVDEILPEAARDTGPVSLRWIGSYDGGWLPSLLAIDRSGSCDEFREATKPWFVPTWSLVFADVEGHIGYQGTGRVPIRNVWERGYRPGWDPAHQWDGLIPFEGMPRWSDPPRGWIASANNRVAADDFPYPLSGNWTSGYRARRLAQMIEAKEKLSADDFRAMQHDALSLRAQEYVPRLLAVLETSDDPRIAQAAEYLKTWDCRMETESVAATIFDLFFVRWCQQVIGQRFSGETGQLLSGAGWGLAGRLLESDEQGWFEKGNREQTIHSAMAAALDTLGQKFGDEMSQWTWGSLHKISLKHVLSGRGGLGELLDQPSRGVRGDMVTVCNTGNTLDLTAATGAGYRLIADLAHQPPGLWAVDGQSQSGRPGNANYGDQFDDWHNGGYHFIALDRSEASKSARDTLTLRTP